MLLVLVLQPFWPYAQDNISRRSKAVSEHSKENNIQSLENLVNEYIIDSKYIEAEQAIKRYHEKTLTPLNTYRVLLLMARVYRYQRKKDLSMMYFLRAHNIVKSDDSALRRLEFGVELIEFYRKFQEFTLALQEIEQYNELIRVENIEDPLWLGRFYNRYAAVMNELSENQKSIKLSHKSLDYSRKAGDLYSVATSYNELGFSHKHTNYPDSALYFYSLSEELFSELGCHRDAIHVKLNRLEFMNHAELFNTHWDNIAILNDAYDIIVRENIDYSIASIYENLENNYFFLGEYQMAHQYSIKVRQQSYLENKLELEKSYQNIREKFENDKLRLENKSVQSKAKYEEEKRKDTQQKLTIIVILFVIISVLTVVLYLLWHKVKAKNRELIIKNKQKTFLVQEIHHRVKNNLQFVRSILKMQKRLKTLNADESLADISRRIDAMSLVHEMLYVDDDAMTVSVKEYFERLMDLSESIYNQNNKMHIKTDIESLDFPLEKLVALGLICSELLANSVKHVFEKVETPEFSIELKKTSAGHYFKVKDNGIEIEQTKDEERVKLGMRLIDIFSRQVGGQYAINRDSGYEFELIFP